MSRLSAVLAVSLVCLTSSTWAAEATDELEGAWRLISSNGQRHELADDLDHSTLLTFTSQDGMWKLQPRSDSDGQDFSGSYTPDATQTPKLLDAVIQGDGGSTPIYGIYKIEADELTIHFRNDGQRPGDFESPRESSASLVFKKHVTQ